MLNSEAKIITVAAKRLGDCLFLTPSYRYIKHFFPEVQLDVVVLNDLNAKILSYNDYINIVSNQSFFENIDENSTSYTLGLNLHTSPEADEIFRHLHCPVLDCSQAPPFAPQAEQFLIQLESLTGKPWRETGGNYDLFPQKSDKDSINQKLASIGISAEDTVIGMHLGCHGLNKSKWGFRKKLNHKKVWPLENFISLSQKILNLAPNTKIVVTGSDNEIPLADKLIQACKERVYSLMGNTSVLELRALMDRLQAYLVSDTGACHVAAASEVPLVALYRTASISRTGPYPAKPCHRIVAADNVSDVKVDEVFLAVKALLTE